MPPRRRLRRIASALAAGGAAAATPSEPPASPWAPAGHWQQLAPPRVLSEAQRRSYFEHGYLHLEAFISNEWLARLNAVTQEFVEMSRGVKPGAPAGFPDKEARTEQFFVLEESHTPEEPRLTRLTSPVDVHPTYWEFTNGPAADIAADLLGAPCMLPRALPCPHAISAPLTVVPRCGPGPNLKFHHSKLNFKWRDGGGEVKWHQARPLSLSPVSFPSLRTDRRVSPRRRISSSGRTRRSRR